MASASDPQVFAKVAAEGCTLLTADRGDGAQFNRDQRRLDELAVEGSRARPAPGAPRRLGLAVPHDR